jgi:predicted ATP-grasp superfamily ATP-dependent carboligase
MEKKLVTNPRESDGKFALRLESEAAVQRDLARCEANHLRRQQVEQENAAWAAQNGVAVEDLGFLFA